MVTAYSTGVLPSSYGGGAMRIVTVCKIQLRIRMVYDASEVREPYRPTSHTFSM